MGHAALRKIDEDLGFVMWMGDLLNELVYPTLPVWDCQQALCIPGELGVKLKVKIDVPTMNPGLPKSLVAPAS
jgi:hypothetical protein